MAAPEKRMDGERCPDCDRVLLPIHGRSACPACGQIFTGKVQAARKLAEGFDLTITTPRPSPAFNPHWRKQHKSKAGTDTEGML